MKVYIAAGLEASGTWSFRNLGYYFLERDARAHIDRMVADSPMMQRHVNRAATLKAEGLWGKPGYPGPNSKYMPWERETRGGHGFPNAVRRLLGGSLVTWWTANSTGGVGPTANNWSQLLVVEVEVMGSAVDRLAELGAS